MAGRTPVEYTAEQQQEQQQEQATDWDDGGGSMAGPGLRSRAAAAVGVLVVVVLRVGVGRTQRMGSGMPLGCSLLRGGLLRLVGTVVVVVVERMGGL